MNIRTDLAIEYENLSKEDIKITQKDNIKIYETNIKNDSFITIEFPDILKILSYEKIENEIINSLKKMIDENVDNILVAGLGNTEITCDSVGPLSTSKIVATRHIKGDFAENLGLSGLKSVSVINPNVLGKTGIETAEIIKALTDKIKPKAVILIDALSAMSINNIFKTIQITNAGISPGSGVKNSRKEINQKFLGVPVIAIGVPTVVNSNVLAEEISGRKIKSDYSMILTPKDADFLIKKLSEIISNALNVFLQPKIEKEVILNLE